MHFHSFEEEENGEVKQVACNTRVLLLLSNTTQKIQTSERTRKREGEKIIVAFNESKGENKQKSPDAIQTNFKAQTTHSRCVFVCEDDERRRRHVFEHLFEFFCYMWLLRLNALICLGLPELSLFTSFLFFVHESLQGDGLILSITFLLSTFIPF